MTKSIYYIFAFILCAASPVRADPPETLAGSDVWLLTLETIKSKAKELMAQNTQLAAEYNALVLDINGLDASITEQGNKNAALADFLKTRNGRTDQQLRLEELEGQLKEKKVQLNDRQREYDGFKGQAAALEHKVKLKQLKVSDWELRQNAQAQGAPAVPAAAPADPLDGLRKELEAEKAKEVRMEADLAHLSGAPAASLPQASRVENKGRYLEALRKKAELGSKIRDFEGRLGQMKGLDGPGGEDAGKKKLIRDIIQMDDANKDMRDKAGRLREDIALLRDQIGDLERRSSLTQGK